MPNPLKILFTIMALAFSACTPYVYQPQTPLMPLAGNQGELKADLHGNVSGWGLQVSYALDSHIVAGAAFSRLLVPSNIGVNLSPFAPGVENVAGEFCAGYYTKMGRYGRFELLAGGGYGKTKGSDTVSGFIAIDAGPSIYTMNAGYANTFIQADIGSVHKNTEFGFSMRFSQVIPNGTYQESSSGFAGTFAQNFNFSHQNGTALLFQPTVMFAVGFERIKLNFCAGVSANLTPNDITRGSSIYQPFILSAGITYNLGRK